MQQQQQQQRVQGHAGIDGWVRAGRGRRQGRQSVSQEEARTLSITWPRLMVLIGWPLAVTLGSAACHTSADVMTCRAMREGRRQGTCRGQGVGWGGGPCSVQKGVAGCEPAIPTAALHRKGDYAYSATACHRAFTRMATPISQA